MAEQFKFTEAAVRDIEPHAKRMDYRDTVVSKLYCRVTPAGTKTYYYVTRLGRRVEWLKLGRYPEMKINAARRAAERAASEFSLGRNPAEERREGRATLTLGDVWKSYRADYVRRSGKALPTLDSQWRTALAKWEKRALPDISKAMVLKMRNDIADRASVAQSNRVLTMLRAMFNFASRTLDYDGGNPTATIDKFTEKGRIRRRRLKAADMPAFLAALGSVTPLMRDFLLCCLLIGARSGNIKAMRWVDLDLEGGIWTIPATKSGEPVEVVLSAPVVALLQARLKAARKAVERLRREKPDEEHHQSPYVFATDSKRGHLVEYKKAWRSVCDAAGVSDLRVHDLRRTLSSFAQEAGAGVSVVAAQLGHTDAETTLRHYTNVGTPEHRKAMNATAKAILKAAGVKP